MDAFESQNNPVDFNTYLDQAFHPETLRMELENPDTEFYLVYDNKTLVGYFKVNRGQAQTEIKDALAMELERIYVLQEFQGRKIGRWMVDRVRKLGMALDITYLWLGVWEKNTGAISFYESLGFYKFGSHPYFIGKDKQTDWLMRLDLVTLNGH